MATAIKGSVQLIKDFQMDKMLSKETSMSELRVSSEIHDYVPINHHVLQSKCDVNRNSLQLQYEASQTKPDHDI